MKLTIESTTKIVTIVVNGAEIEGRVWEGKTESGIPVACLITRVAVDKNQNQEQFERELKECRAPTRIGIEAIPLRFIL